MSKTTTSTTADMNWRAAIPNALTLGNLACGVLAIFFLIIDSYRGIPVAAMLIILAAVFDLLDGAVARMLRVSSSLGIQLDSLADLVSFGVAPNVTLMTTLALARRVNDLEVWAPDSWILFVMLTAFALASAYRLARFNVEDDSSSRQYFSGLPTPASGVLLALMCCLMLAGNYFELKAFEIIPLLTCLTLSLAMVSRWPFLSFKGSTRDRLALVAVFATGALLAWLTDWQPWVVLATLALYAVVSRVLITPVRRAA